MMTKPGEEIETQIETEWKEEPGKRNSKN